MKRLIIALFVGWMLASTELVYGLSAGFYGGDHTISAGESADIEFRFTGQGPVDFSYTDGMYFYHVYNVSESPYFFSVSPITTTTYELCVVQNSLGDGTILESNKYVTVYVGSGGGTTVQMTFTPPNLCQNANPIDLRNYFSSNVSGTVWFRGDGVEDNVFYPQSAGVGSHYIESFLSYNGTTYSVGSNISVDAMPQVTLWLPNEVLQNSDPFVLSGGRPSGGIYFVDGIVCGNTFDPSMFSVGWHIVTYTYTALSGCQDTAETKIYIRASGFGIEEDEEDSEFSLYPNPTSGTVHFKVPCSVEVISQYRVSMYRSNSLQESVDLSAFPAGIYMLRLCDGEKVVIRRVVKI